MDVKEAVRHYRKGAGLRREVLAVESGVSYDTICAIEQGRTTPSLQTAAALAKALGRTIDELVYFEAKGRYIKPAA